MESQLIVDGEVVFLPSEIIDEPSNLKQALSASTWELLDATHKSQLLELLPQSLSVEDRKDTVHRLFSGDNLSPFKEESFPTLSGNPIDVFISKVKEGHFSPAAYELRRYQSKAIRAKNKYLQSRYYHELLKDVIVSRQCHLAAATFPQLMKLSKRNLQNEVVVDKEAEIKLKNSAEKNYTSIIRGIHEKVKTSLGCTEEDVMSSDSESEAQTSHTTSGSVYSISQLQLKEMMHQHRKRREAKVNTPDMQVGSIKLAEVFTRTFGSSKKMTGMPLKRKRDETLKYTKQKKRKNPVQVKKKVLQETKAAKSAKPTASGIDMPACFFQLIKNAMLVATEKTTACISSLVSDWLFSAEASRCEWTSTRSNWIELVETGLEYLSKAQMVDNSLVRFIESTDGAWSWIRLKPNIQESDLLHKMCDKWTKEVVEKMPVPESTDEGSSFHAQERRRFSHAHQTFVYSIDGKRYPVPPVKGTSGPAKGGKVAREHSLLKSERPPLVTLLALTRDAVARLPGGQGSRNEVCGLIKESQYLAEVVPEAQINAAVSGALDRLHYESDPCVKYEPSARSWVYLHGDRTPDDLERIHIEQLGAPRRKKERGAKSTNGKRQKLKNPESSKPIESKMDVAESPVETQPAILQNTTELKVSSVDVTNVDRPTSPLPDATSSLVIDESISKKNTKNKQTTSKKKTKKPKSPTKQIENVSTKATENQQAPKSVPARSVQLTQKQLLEITKKVPGQSLPHSSKEVIVTKVDPQTAAKKDQPIKIGQVVVSSKPTAPPVQTTQPSLKLILKPATVGQEKPVAELVRVVDSGSQRNQPGGNRHVLSADTLRRLSEELSAVSSRPIKIVQQPVQGWHERLPQNAQTNQTSPKVINITSRKDVKLPTAGATYVKAVNANHNLNIASSASVAPSTGVANALSSTGNRTVYITANKNGDAVFNQGKLKISKDVASEEAAPRIVHIIQKRPGGASAIDGSNANAITSVKGARPQNIQVFQGKPQTLQILSGGKIQTVQVMRQANAPSPANQHQAAKPPSNRTKPSTLSLPDSS